jgi:cytochrome c-type biogenesis protein CcmH
MMAIFWCIAALALAIALWFIVPTLQSGGRSESQSRREHNLAIFKERLADLDADVQRGTLSEADAEQARRELEQASLQDIAPGSDAEGQDPPTSRLAPRWSAAAIAIGLPAAAVGLYLLLGGGPSALQATPAAMQVSAATSSDATTETSAPHTSGTSNLSVAEATDRLAARLQREPDDVDGWQLLASSYEYLGRTKEAADAAARAAALRGVAGQSVSPPAMLASPSTAPAQTADPAQLAEIIGVSSATGAARVAAGEGMNASTAELEAAVASRPQDVDALVALGRGYQASKRYADAGRTYAAAIKLKPQDASLLADYGDVLAAANGSWLPGEPMQWIDKALSLDPTHPKALWLAATAATQQGDHQGALVFWQRLQQVLPPDSADAAAVAANIAETRNALPASTDPSPAVQSATATQATARTEIRGTVKLDPELASGVAADDTVFIFARAANGPRMPLAVLRKQGRDLPVEFVLDDSMAMTPSMRLSDFPDVVVGARVSKSGEAIPQPGDLEGLSGVIDAGNAKSVDIVIDRKKS